MKYKSILFAAISFLIAFLISCETSNVDDIYTSPDNVSFTISQDDNCTKGTPIDRVKKLSNIGVFATLTQAPYADAEIYEPNFMVNQEVDNVGDKWEYDPPREWSNKPDEQISFFAYAPFATDENGITIVEKSGEMPTIRFEVPQTNKDQPDLMVATPAYDRVKAEGAVGLKFRHALAAISFSVKGDPFREISAVKLSNIFSAATIALDSPDIAWSYTDKRSTQSYELGLKGGVTAPSNGDDATSITANNGYLMMIPQDITDVTIEVMIDGERESIALNFESCSEWVAGAKYNYVVDLENDTFNYDISQTSNCYIVNNSSVKELYIPVDQRINAFWHDYSGLNEAEAYRYMIGGKSAWGAEILWFDNDNLNIADVTTVAPYYGKIPKDNDSSKSFVYDDTNAVMKVTLPANGAIGNLLITVTKEIDEKKSVLWSWHLWVTDYNPDSDSPKATNAVEYAVEGGKIHRYTKDSNFWKTGRYSKAFTMDRDLGSHDNMSSDGLFYQWGRKDPFSTIAEWNKSLNQATFITAVQNPKTFYRGLPRWCIEPDDEAYAGNKYLWYDIKLTNNDTNTFARSIFDPSPLGWCMPLRAGYNDLGTTKDYEGVVYFCLSGDIIPTTGEINDVNSSTSLWCSDKASSNKAYYPHILSTTSISVKEITTAYGHRVRPVKIPRN